MNTFSSSVEYAVMYASAWIFVSAPTVVSFSTSEPRPTTTSSPIVTRSRTHAWSPTITRAPSVVPAKTIAPVETIVPGPRTAGGSGSRFAVERGESVGCFPTTAPSRILQPGPITVPGATTTCSPISTSGGNGGKRVLELLEDADDDEPIGGDAAGVAPAGHEVEECLALEPERLVGVDLRAELVAGARAPLAVAPGRLPRRLLVDGHLVLQLHVVEHRHLVAADDRDPPHLLRVEPRQVHVRDLPGGEAEVAEDDVLDARVEERVPVRD